MSLSPGSRLGPYEILAPLGAGGMGEVYRARDARLGRDVAIKVLPEELSADSGRLKRFEKEARAASVLNHPNIVTIHEIGRTDETFFIVMELVSGKTLRELVAPGPLPTRRVLSIGAETAEGLAKAHAAGIVHRDLKPENLMVTEDGHVKILDFGLAKLTQAETTAQGEATHAPTVSRGTEPGVVMGTVGYMSPEQASGLPLDYRSDQFSFGSVLYELTTGRPAFEKRTRPETLAAIIREEPEPIVSLAPKTPAPLRWIVERCLAKEPRERYASTEDLARDLDHLKNHVSEATGAVEAVAAQPSRRGRRLAPAILAAGLLAAVAIGFLAGRQAAPRPSTPSFQKLTFRRGEIGEARFAPDGQTVVYNAAWDGNPTELFTTRIG
ncbi:MAG: serine/threonine-protein kinase, partial [Acidobacteriota bacterium]